MSGRDQVWVHWGEHIDGRGYWVKRDRGCYYCAVIMGARPGSVDVSTPDRI